MYYAGRLFELEREPALCWNDAVIVTGGSHLLFVQVVSPLSVLLVLTRVNFRFLFFVLFFSGFPGRSWTCRAIKIHEKKRKNNNK
jgi:hypothetical protein